MSKSFKKHPILKDGGRSKKSTRSIANRIVRSKLKNSIELVNGNAYKKLFNSYNIVDNLCILSEEEARHYYQQSAKKNRLWVKDYINEDDFINRYWKKLFYRK